MSDKQQNESGQFDRTIMRKKIKNVVKMDHFCGFSNILDGWVGGWLGWCLEDWRVMLNSTHDKIKLKLKFELSFVKMIYAP